MTFYLPERKIPKLLNAYVFQMKVLLTHLILVFLILRVCFWASSSGSSDCHKVIITIERKTMQKGNSKTILCREYDESFNLTKTCGIEFDLFSHLLILTFKTNY